MIDFEDEILEGEPRYRVRDADGNLIHDNVSIELATGVIQEGTPLNKVFFDLVNDEFKISIPKGLICMWSGSTVPNGWHLCDGESGTPDLRDRFVVGAGNDYEVGETGGSNTVTLTQAQMPSHNHSINVATTKAYLASSNESPIMLGSGSTSTTSAGGNQAHENRPPYYALAYIMKIYE